MDNFDPQRALQHADDLARRARDMEEEAKTIEIAVTSPDQSISVTVSVTGRIESLRLTERATESRNHEELAAAILMAIKHAQTASDQAANDLTNRFLPDLSKFREFVGVPGKQERKLQ